MEQSIQFHSTERQLVMRSTLKNTVECLAKALSEVNSERRAYQFFLSNKECLTCGQAISESRLERISEKTAQTLESIRSSLSKLQQQQLEFSSELPSLTTLSEYNSYRSASLLNALELQQLMERVVKSLESDYQTLNKAIENERLFLSSLQNKLIVIERELLQWRNTELTHQNNMEKALSLVDQEISRLKSEGTQMTKFNSVKKEVQSMEISIGELENHLCSLNEELQRAKFWELAFDKKSKAHSGFSSLRAFLLSESVQEINSIFSSYMEKLTNTPLTVTLTADLEMEEHYGKRSGGERKRSDLVTLFSLFELVRHRTRFNSHFLFLDEVFDALDKDGQMAVRGLLEILSENLKKIFVVTHHDITQGMQIAGVIQFRMLIDEGKRPLGTEVEIIPQL